MGRTTKEFTQPKIEAVVLLLRTSRISSNRLKTWWPGTELNRRRQPFQGCALPPELPGHVSRPAAWACEDLSGPTRFWRANDWNHDYRKRVDADDYSNRCDFPQRLSDFWSKPHTLSSYRLSHGCLQILVVTSEPTGANPFFRFKRQSLSRTPPGYAARCQTAPSRSTVSDLPSTPFPRYRDGSTGSLPRILSGTWPL